MRLTLKIINILRSFYGWLEKRYTIKYVRELTSKYPDTRFDLCKGYDDYHLVVHNSELYNDENFANDEWAMVEKLLKYNISIWVSLPKDSRAYNPIIKFNQ